MPLPSTIDLFENAINGQVFDPNRFNSDQKAIQDTVNQVIIDLIRHYDPTLSTDHDNRYMKIIDLLTTPFVATGSQSWIATAGQTDFVLTNGAYRVGVNGLVVSVGGVLQTHTDIEEVTSTLFKIPSGVPVGEKVYAFWFSAFTSQIATHAIEHSPTGSDSLNAYYASREEFDLVTHNLSEYRSSKDPNGVFTVVEWKRPNGTLHSKSTLSGGTSPNYTTETLNYYDDTGTAISKTVTYTLSYDVDDDLISRVVGT